MTVKLGFLLLAAAAAVLAFAGGTLAPDSVGKSVKDIVAAAKHLVAPASASAASTSASTASTSAARNPESTVASGAAAPAAAPASSAAGTTTVTVSVSVPMGSILLPTLLPGTGTYALQAAQFASQQAAEQLAAGISGQGVTSTVIITTDSAGTTWAVVALGRFTSPTEALSQRSYLANKLGLSQYLVPVLLPPPKPSS